MKSDYFSKMKICYNFPYIYKAGWNFVTQIQSQKNRDLKVGL